MIGDRMETKKLAFGMMTVAFILIISGGVSSFVLGLKADREATSKRMENVTDTFEVFSANTSVFEVFRDELYNDVLGDLYYETMYQSDSAVKNKLSNYENLVDELEKNTRSLKNLCEDVYYPNGDINIKCSNYKSIYEQVVNYFVTDIHKYNDNVKKYNNYQASLGTNFLIEEYKTKKDYIDFNSDKKYDGKEE